MIPGFQKIMDEENQLSSSSSTSTPSGASTLKTDFDAVVHVRYTVDDDKTDGISKLPLLPI